MAQVVELMVCIHLPEVTGSIPGVSHKFRTVQIIIPASLIKLSSLTVNTQLNIRGNSNQGYMSICDSECSLEQMYFGIYFLNPRWHIRSL